MKESTDYHIKFQHSYLIKNYVINTNIIIAFHKDISYSIIIMIFKSLSNKALAYLEHLRHDEQQLSLSCSTEALLTAQYLGHFL